MLNQNQDRPDSPFPHTFTVSFSPKPFQEVDTSPNPFKTPRKPKPLNDRCRQKHLLKDQNIPSYYFLKANLLDLTDFSSFIRARMRCWITQELAKRNISRQSCALSNYLMDLFFMKKGQIPLANLQELGIACMIIASKLNQSQKRIPQACQSTFSKDKIAQLQFQVMRRLEFRLNPQTHINYAQYVIKRWNLYLEQKLKEVQSSQVWASFPRYSLLDQESFGGFNLLNMFLELLDISMMVIGILDYDIQDVVMNTFFLLTKNFLQLKTNLTSSLYEAIIKEFTNELLSDSEFKIGCVLYDLCLQKKVEVIYNLVMKEDHKKFKGKSDFTKDEIEVHYSSSIQVYHSYYFKVAKQLDRKLMHAE